jgi:uncharacterized protein YjiS (DUF1127 family)
MRPSIQNDNKAFPGGNGPDTRAPYLGRHRNFDSRRNTMLRFFRSAFDAVLAAQERRARWQLAQRLDERTLRDIGLEAEANAVRERSRLALRFGGY